jgi:hypothetical protein
MEQIPWKLSGRKVPGGRSFVFDSKQKQHFFFNGGVWSMRLLKDSVSLASVALCTLVLVYQSHVSAWVLVPGSHATRQETWTVCRAVMSNVGGTTYPMIVELTSPDSRKLHLVRLCSWPAYVDDAVRFPGSGMCSRGQWTGMGGGPQRPQ